MPAGEWITVSTLEEPTGFKGLHHPGAPSSPGWRTAKRGEVRLIRVQGRDGITSNLRTLGALAGLDGDDDEGGGGPKEPKGLVN